MSVNTSQNKGPQIKVDIPGEPTWELILDCIYLKSGEKKSTANDKESKRSMDNSKSFRMARGSDTYKEFQSLIDKRGQFARIVSKKIKDVFVPGKPCYQSWKSLFTTDSFQVSPGLGSGMYGSARLVTLRAEPSLDLAIKRTKKMEFDEVYNTILAGSLPEVGANPHFNIFYMHLHCEDMETQLYKTMKHRLINWKDAEARIRTLITRMNQNPLNKDAIQKEITEIETLAYPSLNDVHTFHEFKLQQDHEFFLKYGNMDPDDIPPGVTRAMRHIRDTYYSMQKARGKYHQPYEYILMELSEPGLAFKTWVQQVPPTAHLISAAFQVCMGALSLMAFFKLTQNDLLLNNITYSKVNSDVFYVYKIGLMYMRVPLYGKLVKIFDFGLTTDEKKFYLPTRLNNVPTHWCVGGRGSGSEDQLSCSVYVRDILELFYRLDDEYGCNDFNICLPKDKNLAAWISYAHKKVQGVTEDSISNAVSVVLELFGTSTMIRFNLPQVVYMSTTPIPLSRYQTRPFEVVNRKKYIGEINKVIDQKVWEI
jgi:hypothetical protein